MNVIKINHVSKKYATKIARPGFGGKMLDLVSPLRSEVEVLKDIQLEVAKGECLGFLGPNGAGKSTLTKILCGLQRPTEGSVEVLGLNPEKKEKALYQNIGVVFGHKSSLWWDLPVIESLKCAKVVYGISDKDFDPIFKELTESLNLTGILNRPVRLLSLGERVKAELAANMLHKPKVLLLDEPTIGLDVVSKAQLRQHIRRWAKTYGTAVFLTSHDVGDIESCCDRIVLIDDGRIAFNGSINNFKSEIDHVCIVTVAHGSRPLSLEEITQIGLMSSGHEINEKGIGIEITLPVDLKSNLLAELARFSSELHLTTRGSTLEEGLARRFVKK